MLMFGQIEWDWYWISTDMDNQNGCNMTNTPPPWYSDQRVTFDILTCTKKKWQKCQIHDLIDENIGPALSQYENYIQEIKSTKFAGLAWCFKTSLRPGCDSRSLNQNFGGSHNPSRDACNVAQHPSRKHNRSAQGLFNTRTRVSLLTKGNWCFFWETKSRNKMVGLFMIFGGSHNPSQDACTVAQHPLRKEKNTAPRDVQHTHTRSYLTGKRMLFEKLNRGTRWRVSS